MKPATELFVQHFSHDEALALVNTPLKLANTSPPDGWAQSGSSTNGLEKPNWPAGEFPDNPLGAVTLVRGYEALRQSSTVPWS